MSFWIRVDVIESGDVIATTYSQSSSGNPCSAIRKRHGSTVSQALRSLAAAMVTAKAETIDERKQA
jgi:hypothetical protein